MLHGVSPTPRTFVVNALALSSGLPDGRGAFSLKSGAIVGSLGARPPDPLSRNRG